MEELQKILTLIASILRLSTVVLYSPMGINTIPMDMEPLCATAIQITSLAA